LSSKPRYKSGGVTNKYYYGGIIMANVIFRGISGVIRRSINNGTLVGRIEPHIVRHLLPDSKKAAPDTVIIKSLKYLATMNEIQEKGSEFFTKTPTTPKAALPEVSVIGGFISVKIVDGRSIVTIDAVDMEYL